MRRRNDDFLDTDVNNLPDALKPEYNQHFIKSDIPIYNGEHEKTYDCAIKNIQEDRESDYGDATVSMRSIGDFWGTYLTRKLGTEIQLDEIDVAQMMTLFKINRNAFRRKEDNFVDGEAYANFATGFFMERERSHIVKDG